MEIPELTSLLRAKIQTKTEDYQKLDKQKTEVQADLVQLLHVLEEIVKGLHPLLNETKAVSMAFSESRSRKDKDNG